MAGPEHDLGERVAKLEEWANGHEDRCEERLGFIKVSLDRLFDWMKALIAAIAALLIGLLGWTIVQLYQLEPLRVTVTATPPAAMSVAHKP